MFVAITNTPRDYAWGAIGKISALLGTEASGRPEAELWLGAHPGSPSQIIDPAQTGGSQDLAAWITADSSVALGSASPSHLTFLLKVLSAALPLSLQAHPTAHQAAAGFARENDLGIELNAPHRNYRDPYPKPEIIVALSETFEALCGFRPVSESVASISRLLAIHGGSTNGESADAPLHEWLHRLEAGEGALRDTVEWLLSGVDPIPELVATVVALARVARGEFPVIVELADSYPGDPGILISLMLHHVVLRRGEALSLPAGNIHAYLHGLGIELMTSSDNVLRGGLTNKHVDVPELLSVLDFSEMPAPRLAPERAGEHLELFRPVIADFVLAHISGDATLTPSGAAIALCIDGVFDLSGSQSTRTLAAGDCIFVTPDEGELHFIGSGTAFLATSA